MSALVEKNLKSTTRTILNYELTNQLDGYINYLFPSVASFVLYTLLFASDCGVAFRHYKDENPIWAGLTIFFMYLPALACYILTVSMWELWPQREGCGIDNTKWFLLKTFQHLLFPIWAIWRCAEKIFWSIEAVINPDPDLVSQAKITIEAPRNAELYLFLQAFLQSLPQMLLQLNIIMRQDQDTNRQTADSQIMSLVFNLSKLAATVTFYHRFKSQKLAGKQYPWFKPYKYSYEFSVDQPDSTKEKTQLRSHEGLEAGPSSSRRSSDFYLEPEPEPVGTKDLKEVVGCIRETSIVDGPKRVVYKEESDEPDFNIKRLIYVKALPDDDMAGKLVAFCWWFCFLLARVLAISTFAYFYPSESIWLLTFHFLIVVGFLVYDVKTDEVKRSKALFFLFIGLIYIFCIIEFKIKFKKTKFIYTGFFTLVFTENLVMCLIWWTKNVAELEADFWFRYIFYLVVMCSLISCSSMILYLNINKPQKIVVGAKPLN